MCKDVLRRQLIELYSEGRSVDEICNEYAIPKSTFYRWIRKSRDESPKISDDDVNIIITRLSKLEEEAMTYKKILQLLKKVEVR